MKHRSFSSLMGFFVLTLFISQTASAVELFRCDLSGTPRYTPQERVETSAIVPLVNEFEEGISTSIPGSEVIAKIKITDLEINQSIRLEASFHLGKSDGELIGSVSSVVSSNGRYFGFGSQFTESRSATGLTTWKINCRPGPSH